MYIYIYIYLGGGFNPSGKLVKLDLFPNLVYIHVLESREITSNPQSISLSKPKSI